jgi:hypothetical protein
MTVLMIIWFGVPIEIDAVHQNPGFAGELRESYSNLSNPKMNVESF